MLTRLKAQCHKLPSDCRRHPLPVVWPSRPAFQQGKPYFGLYLALERELSDRAKNIPRLTDERLSSIESLVCLGETSRSSMQAQRINGCGKYYNKYFQMEDMHATASRFKYENKRSSGEV